MSQVEELFEDMGYDYEKAKVGHKQVVFYAEGQCAGFASTFMAEDIIYVPFIIVRPSLQRKGIGTKLIRFLVNDYEKEGRLKPIMVKCKQEVVPFFRRSGFTPVGEAVNSEVTMWMPPAKKTKKVN